MNSTSSASLRISDADRDQAIAELSEHFQAGRLSTDELDDRTGRALQARTAADLAALFTDLPRQHAAAPAASVPAATAPATPGSRRPPVTPLAIIAIVVAAAIISSHPGLLVLIPIAALLIIRRRSAASTGRTDA
jgi:hypothetical protein